MDALPVPSPFETLPQLLAVATELLCTRDKSRCEWYARIWFDVLLAKAVLSLPGMPSAYPHPTFTLEPYLRRKRDVLLGKGDKSCHGCGEYIKSVAVVYSAICGQYLCDPGLQDARVSCWALSVDPQIR